MNVERRRKRSSVAKLALRYWLAAEARRAQLFAMVIADSSGLLLGASMGGPEVEELAALAPLVARPEKQEGFEQPPARIPLQVRRIRHQRETLYLCAVGETAAQTPYVRFDSAVTGVSRILDEYCYS